MKHIALALAALVAFAAPLGGVAPAMADSSTNPLCGPDAPEGYKRPGGYCEQIDNKGSLIENKDCDYQPAVIGFSMMVAEPRLLLAADCYVLEKKVVGAA